MPRQRLAGDGSVAAAHRNRRGGSRGAAEPHRRGDAPAGRPLRAHRERASRFGRPAHRPRSGRRALTPTGTFDGLEARALACAAGYRTLFASLDLRIAPGEWTMLVGANGSGKSTLLRTIAGLARPLAGEILWRGAPRKPDDAEWRAQCVYQGHAAGWKDA